MAKLLWQSENPRAPQGLRVLSKGSGLGVEGHLGVLALSLVAGQAMHGFLCL